MSDQLFDGVTRDEAIRRAVRRAGELSPSQVDFIQRLGKLTRALNGAEAHRLEQLMVKFRQEDLVAQINAADGNA